MEIRSTIWFAVALSLLCLRGAAQTGTSDGAAQTGAPGGTAQQNTAPQSTAPAPAYGQATPSVFSIENPPVSSLDSAALEPNLRPRSMLQGGVVASEALDTNVNGDNGPDSSSLHSETRILGGLTAERLWERYSAAAAYVGGVGIYPNVNPQTRNIQEAQGQGTVQWKTGQVSLRDSFSYLPEGTFGAGTFGGASGFQLGLGGLSQMGDLSAGTLGGQFGFLGVGQFGSLGEAPRITNVTLADALQQLSPRSAVTAVGSYAIIHFTGDNKYDFINSDQIGADVGYSYALTPRDQVGAVYAFRAFLYPVSSGAGSVDSHIVQALYGHRISGRMDLILGAGPQVTIINAGPQSSSSSNLFTSSSTTVTASARASLRYRFERAGMALTYLRINTTGSGFFAGAESDLVRLAGTYDFARRWHGRLDVGASHNDRLQGATGGVNAGSFAYIFAGGGVEREFNRNLGAFVAYQYNVQIFGDLTGCSLNCNNRASRQVIQFGASWHFRPIRLD